jgi:hypothetical protein
VRDQGFPILLVNDEFVQKLSVMGQFDGVARLGAAAWDEQVVGFANFVFRFK